MATQTPNTILVTGAAGHLGSSVIENLLRCKKEGGEGINVIAASRDLQKVEACQRLGAETRYLDLDSCDSVEKAFKGVDCVILISTVELGTRIEQHRCAIRAAEKMGVKRLIYTSFLSPKPGEGVFSDHFYTEADLVESKLKWTILRNTSYSETLFATLPSAVSTGVLYTASGDGKRTFMSREDCAILIANVAVHADRYENRILDVVGNKAYTADDIAAIASKVTNKQLNVKRVDDKKFMTEVKSAAPDWWSQIAVDFEQASRGGYLGITNNCFKDIVGREPLSLEDFLERNRDSLLQTR